MPTNADQAQVVALENQAQAQLNEIEKVELEYIYEGIVRVEARRVQLGVFFGTANITIVALGLQQQKPGIILVAVFCNMLAVLAEASALYEMAAFYFSAFLIERKHLGNESFTRTYFQIFSPHVHVVEEFEELASLPYEELRARKVRHLMVNPFGPKGGPLLCFVILSLVEIALAWWLSAALRWSIV